MQAQLQNGSGADGAERAEDGARVAELEGQVKALTEHLQTANKIKSSIGEKLQVMSFAWRAPQSRCDLRSLDRVSWGQASLRDQMEGVERMEALEQEKAMLEVSCPI